MCGYTSAIPLKTLSVTSVCEAIITFLSIMPCMRTLKSDHGGEMSIQLAQELSKYGKTYCGFKAQRSQQQASAEKSIQ